MKELWKPERQPQGKDVDSVAICAHKALSFLQRGSQGQLCLLRLFCLPWFTKFSKRRRVSEGSGDASKETSERQRWTTVLGRLLEGTGTPISGWLARSRSSSALLGAGRRVSTLRSRVRALRSLLLWIWERQGVRFYFTPFPLVDYLQELVEQGCKIGCLFWGVRCRDRGAGSRHQIGDLPVIVRGDPCFSFTGCGAWSCAEAIGYAIMGSGECGFGHHSAALHPGNGVVEMSSDLGRSAAR